ncbi:hypothetical protein ARMA_1241 [Ardenticatena maritima]|uniref:Uncharacterized protein n=1 Tax=Ardenticatena maritima TaxID=872965 RepID=A0A0M9UCG6_9CHLR|nr:hypothetical protein ARMA_1241 [Ardenticatena maritima]
MKFLRNAIVGIRQSQNIERRKSYWLACILAHANLFCNVCQLCFFAEQAQFWYDVHHTLHGMPLLPARFGL